MPPEATMITSAPPPSQAISSMSSYPADSKHLGERNAPTPRDNGHGHKMGKSERNYQPSNGYASSGHASSHSSNGYSQHMSVPSGNMIDNEAGVNGVHHVDVGDQLEMDPQPTTRDEQHGDVGESRESKNDPFKEPLHKALYDNFQTDLTSLREATIEALQLSCQEQERLCLKGEELEARIAYMRKKIVLARDELLEKGALKGEELDDDLRLSLVKEGEEEMNATGGLGTLEEGKSAENGMTRVPSTGRFSNNRAALHGSLVSKRFSRSSSLHGSQTTQFSKGSNISEATNMPHMSRSSLLGMLGASKHWLDNYANTSNECEESTRGSNASFRISFMEGAGDGMPSRWRAREQEREKTAKQKEEEERRLQQSAAANEMNMDGNSNSLPMKEKTKGEKLQDLISKREEEISTLEKRTMTVMQETSSLQDEISILEIDKRHEESEFERDRRKLIAEINQVESDNERLDHMLVETGVSLEEKKIIIEILATELKGAREELAHIQNERDRLNAQRRRKGSRARRWSGWMRNSASSLLGLDVDQDEGEQNDEHQQQQTPQSAQAQAQGQGKQMSRYQVSNDVLQQYQTLVSGSDSDTSADNLDPSGSGGSSGNQGLDRRRSYASVGTCMSSLTLDSNELVDILEQLELDSEN